MIDDIPLEVASSLKVSFGGSVDNIMDCGNADGCLVQCDDLMNKVTISYNQGDEDPTVTCAASLTPLTVQIATDLDGFIDFANALDFDTLSGGEYDYLVEDVAGDMTLNFQVHTRTHTFFIDPSPTTRPGHTSLFPFSPNYTVASCLKFFCFSPK